MSQPNPHPPSARRMRVAATIAARDAQALTDLNLACVLQVWTPLYRSGYPLDRNHDADPIDPGNE